MNLGDKRRELITSMLQASTIPEVREIQAELRRVDAKITQVRAEMRNDQDPTGRLADLATLRNAFDRAPNQGTRAKIAQIAANIRNEPEHARRLRREMLTAQRAGNRSRAREIGEHLFSIHG